MGALSSFATAPVAAVARTVPVSASFNQRPRLAPGARDGTRTRGLFLTKEVLCRLSYASPTRFGAVSGPDRHTPYPHGESNPGFLAENQMS